ncbi:hypothetical protein KUTeg_023551 [Tegillarca granosa]|uniref:LRRCT domain-containing protein n=1 Tax=Tegillarca granosa TaxID=220873 RepID=A0ABQ9E4Y4_TEGGR|nr:hypothetical protein KUTeg_023551 [Tegillarca granosa]
MYIISCNHLPSILLLCLAVDVVAGYLSHSGRHSGNGEWSGDCPEKCRCMALIRRGSRGVADGWDIARHWGSQRDGPSSRHDTVNNRRSMVCQGLRRLPNPIPSDIITITIYGDSSSVTPDQPSSRGEQDDHHIPFLTSTQLRHINRDSFRGNTRLTEITFSGNNIGVLYPYIFHYLRSLHRLSLQNNNIRHLSAAVFRGLLTLKELELSDNTIQYLPQAVFNYVPNLKSLNLNGNKIQRLQRNQFKPLIQLKRLDLSRNNISDLHDDTFDRNVELEELLLSGNRIGAIRTRWFRNLRKLRILSLRGNIINNIPQDSFSSLYSLEELLLSANHIKQIQDASFLNLRRLKILDLSTNDIGELASSSFSGLRSLEELYLSNNKITRMDNGTFTSLRTVIRLDISRNHLERVESETFYSLRKLQYLDLSHNKLRILPTRLIYGLIELKQLKLDHNFIRVIRPRAFVSAPGSSLSKLSSLSLHFNDIRKLESESFIGLTNLKSLSLDNNKIRRVHSLAFTSLINLRSMKLNNNRLKNLNNGAFTNLHNVIKLDLSTNKFRSIPANMFSGLRNLEELKLATNGIHDISPGSFESLNNLYELDLKENKLMNFNFSLVWNIRPLYTLDLRDNHLFRIDIPSNISSVKIKELFLAENNLQSVKKDIQKIMRDSSILSLSGNPLRCDCQLSWMLVPAISRKLEIEELDQLVCRSPNQLNGKKVTSLKTSELSCSPKLERTENRPTITCSDVPDLKSKVYSGRTAAKTLINRHVTVFDGNKQPQFNGVLLQNGWALVPGNAIKEIQQSTSSDVRAKIGRRKGMKRVVNAIRHPLGAIGMNEYNIGLLQIDVNDSASHPLCVMTVNQFDTVTRIVPRVSVTTRIDGRKPLSKLKVRNGKIHPECSNPSYLCLTVKGKNKGKRKMLLDGSPMYFGQINDLKIAGLGTTLNDPGNKDSLFIPLWTVSEWLERVMDEYNTKCSYYGKHRRCLNISLPTANELLSDVRRPERH